jgi:hypothetical protein
MQEAAAAWGTHADSQDAYADEDETWSTPWAGCSSAQPWGKLSDQSAYESSWREGGGHPMLGVGLGTSMGPQQLSTAGVDGHHRHLSGLEDQTGADRMPFWQGATDYDYDYEEFQKFEEFDTLTEEPGRVMVVNSTSSGAYAQLGSEAATADLVAFDAEWVPDWTMGSDNPISVLQLAFPSSRRVYVLQLEPLGRKLPQAVQMMLVNPEVTKVGFAVSHKDTEKLMRSGIVVTKGSIVDVQDRCAAALGVAWSTRSSLSLKRAAQSLLGCVLDKDKRCACSDWSSEKLTPEQVRYAALDAWVALRLYYRTC